MTKKPKSVKPGTVQKIIKSPFPQEPEKAQIAVEGANHLYREIRIENTCFQWIASSCNPPIGWEL
jgi:hypothetical protein